MEWKKGVNIINIIFYGMEKGGEHHRYHILCNGKGGEHHRYHILCNGKGGEHHRYHILCNGKRGEHHRYHILCNGKGVKIIGIMFYAMEMG